MSMTGKRRKATALLVVFFVLFSALYLSMGMENGGTESGSAASVVTWRSERFSVTEQAEACISLKEAVIRYIHRQDGQKDKSGHKTEKNQLFYEKMTGGYTYGNKHFCRSSDRDRCCGNRICCLA